jgi:hypothetical protein
MNLLNLLDLATGYGDIPANFACVCITAFAYAAALLTVGRHSGRWERLRRCAALAGLVACHVAWRFGLLGRVLCITLALLVAAPSRSRLAPSSLGSRGAPAPLFSVLLSHASPRVLVDFTGHDSQGAAGALSAAVSYAAKISVVSRRDQRPPSELRVAPVRLDYDRIHASLSGARVGGGGGDRIALAIIGSDVHVADAAVDGVVGIVGTGAVLSNVNVTCSTPPCILVADATLQTHSVRVNGHVLEREPCRGSSEAVSCSHPSIDVMLPPWVRIERQMPGAVSWLASATRHGARTGWAAALVASRHAAVASGHAWRYLSVGLQVLARAWADVYCAVTSVTSAEAAAAALDTCPRNYPFLHELAFQLTVVVWAFGLPALGRSIRFAAANELESVYAISAAVAAAAQTIVLPCSAALGTLCESALDALGVVVPAVVAALVDGYLRYIGLMWGLQRSVWGVTASVLASGLGAAWVAVGPTLYVGSVVLAWYRSTSFSSHAAVCSVQTCLIALSYAKEVNQRAAEQQAGATGSFMGRMYARIAWSSSLTAVLSQDVTGLVIYAAAHAIGTLVVTGASLLAIVPLLHSTALHVVFPLASTWAGLRLFGRDSTRTIALTFAARALVTLVFEWTVGDVVYRLVTEVVKPVLLGSFGILCVVVVFRVWSWWRPAAKPKSD